MKVKNWIWRLDNQIVEHLLKRYPTRELMNEYVGMDLKPHNP